MPDAGRMRHINTTATNPSAQLAGERYIALTTFTRDGTTKRTVVWPVDAGDGRIGFITSSRTWKVKRINHDNHVMLQPSDARGRVRDDTRPVSGLAEVVVGEAFESLNRRVKSKYGYQLRIVNMVHALPGRATGYRNDCAIIVSTTAS